MFTEHNLFVPGSLLISRLSCLFSSYDIGLMSSSSLLGCQLMECFFLILWEDKRQNLTPSYSSPAHFASTGAFLWGRASTEISSFSFLGFFETCCCLLFFFSFLNEKLAKSASSIVPRLVRAANCLDTIITLERIVVKRRESQQY